MGVITMTSDAYIALTTKINEIAGKIYFKAADINAHLENHYKTTSKR